MKIRRAVLETIERHARTEFPRESCGILLTQDGADEIRAALPADNEERNEPERAFVLGYRAHLDAVRLECRGVARIVGYYHSHPRGCAAPSRRDAELAVDDMVYLITAVGPSGVAHAAWRFARAGFAAESLEAGD